MSTPSRTPTSLEGSYPELLKLAGPIVLSRVGVMAMGLTDAIVVGHYSAVELGYHSLGWAPTMTVLVAALGLLLGVQVITARHIGAGTPERTGAVLRRGLRYALVIGIVSTFVLAFLGPPVLMRVGIEPDLAAGAGRAMRIFAFSLTPYLLADCFWLWLEAHGKQVIPTIAMWVANGVNLVLALWLVPGNSPFPVAGAEAAAWVTFFARTVFLLVLAGYVLLWSRSRELGVFRRTPQDKRAAAEQRRIGYATGLSYGIEMGCFAALHYVAAGLGALAVAAWAVVINVASVMFMIPLGIGAATGVLVARAAGARNAPAVRRNFVMGLKLALGIVALLSVVVFIFPQQIANAYTSDTALLAIVTGPLVLSCFFFLSDGAQVVSGSALRSRGDIWWPTGMHVFSYVILMLPLSYWLGISLGWGLTGIVWAVGAGSAVSAIGLVVRFFSLGNRIRSETP